MLLCFSGTSQNPKNLQAVVINNPRKFWDEETSQMTKAEHLHIRANRKNFSTSGRFNSVQFTENFKS